MKLNLVNLYLKVENRGGFSHYVRSVAWTYGNKSVVLHVLHNLELTQTW